MSNKYQNKNKKKHKNAKPPIKKAVLPAEPVSDDKKNKFKKEHKKFYEPEKIETGENGYVKIGTEEYQIVYNYREGFNAEKLAERFSPILQRFEYVVGDWGHEQLRLKGFYEATHKRVLPSQRIDTLIDYLYEFCNFGCAFFVLKRLSPFEKTNKKAIMAANKKRTESVNNYQKNYKRKNHNKQKNKREFFIRKAK